MTDQWMPANPLTEPDGLGSVLSLHVELLGRLGTTLDGIERQAKRANDLAAQAGMLTPAATVVPRDAKCPNPSASFSIDLGGPAQGRIWDVRRLVVGGVTYATAAAGAGYAFITPTAAALFASFSLTEWTDYAATLPLNSFYGAGEMTLRFPEKLVVVITSGTADQTYMAAARVVDRMETPTTRSVESVGT